MLDLGNNLKNKNKIIYILSVCILLVAGFLVGGKLMDDKKTSRLGKIPAIAGDVAKDEERAKSDATLFFDKDAVSAQIDKDFDLIARVNPGTNTDQGINAAQLDIVFDPAIVQLTSVKASSPFVEMGAPVIDNEKGTLSVALFIGASQVVETSDLATLTFHAKALSDKSSIAFASSSQVAIMDGKGTMVAGSRNKTLVNIIH